MLIHTRVNGTKLAGNLLGDPTERDLHVYVPPGYEAGDRRYPSVYLLHAFGQDANSLVEPPTDRTRWSPPLVDVLDPLFGRMGVDPLIVVVPDGATRYGCSQWVDSPVTGLFEQYVLHDVVSTVDAHFRTLAGPASRGVLGFSSGGIGAWQLGSRNPDTFGALAMLSGDSYLDVSHKPMLYEYLSTIWPDAPSGPGDGNDLSNLVYAYAAAYSPNPENPPYFVDLPVDHPSGRLVDDVWSRWLAADPVVNWADRVDGLRRLRGILLDAGIADEHHLQWGHRILHAHLTDAGIPHDFTENAGNHGGRSRERMQVALRWMTTVLDGSTAAS